MEFTQLVIDYGIASRPMPGQAESGDGYLVKECAGGVLVTVVDGLGHGPEAAAATRAAIETIEASSQESVAELAQRCHQRLLSTRGAVLSIASLDFDQGTMTWLGIGNVLGLLVRTSPDQKCTQTFLVPRRGLVGQNLPALKAVTSPIQAGDALIFATDGISKDFPQGIDPIAAPHQMANRILDDHALNTDDALVLVVRYLGGGREP